MSLPVMADQRLVIDAIIRTDLYAFLQAFFPTVSTQGPLLLNWHLEAMTAALTKVMRGETRRLIITIPPRSLKSICASVAFPAFVLGHDPSQRIICVSYSEVLARNHANDCRALMRALLYRRLFPATRISSTKDTELEFRTRAGGFRLATSVGGTLTGRGGNLIIIDDPMKPQDALSETARGSVWQWYANTLLPRLDSKVKGSIIVVMQRLHPEDLVGHLLEQGAWEHLNLRAIAEVEEEIALGGEWIHRRLPGSVLHPEREPLEALAELKRTMGSRDFEAQYQQRPIPIGGNLVKWEWFRFYDDPPAPQRGDRLIVSWDTAMTRGELSNYSACVVVLVRGETVFVLDVFRARLEYPELKRKVIDIHQRWRGLTTKYELIIENKGSGMSLIQELKREDIHAIAIVPEGDKAMRMNGQTAHIEAGAVLLPRRAHWLDEFRHEISAFPASRDDDQVDPFSQALKRAYEIPYQSPMAAFGTYGQR